VTTFLVNRFGHAAITLAIVTLVTFVIVSLAPGGFTAGASEGLSKEELDRIRANLGLDQPIHVQYLRWAGALLQGEMGRSLVDGQPVLGLIAERLPSTVLLAGTAMVVSVVLGLVLGVLCAVRAYSWLDNVTSGIAFVGLAVPTFWLGILMILLFSVTLGWLPSSGLVTLGHEDDPVDRLKHILMPASILALTTTPALLRFTRSSLLEVLNQEYIRSARAKGLRERAVLFRHGLRNALIPVITLIGLQLPRLVGGAAIVETVFGWPGIGRLAVNSAFRRDFPVIMGITIVISVAVLLSNLLVDLLYAAVNPRIELE
jgi:peptide/nickel transport system permease protein